MADLDFVPTDELVETLLKRMPCAVIVGERVAETPVAEIVFRWSGDVATAKGYAGFASDLLTDELRLKLPEPEDEEEVAEP